MALNDTPSADQVIEMIKQIAKREAAEQANDDRYYGETLGYPDLYTAACEAAYANALVPMRGSDEYRAFIVAYKAEYRDRMAG